MWFLGGLYVGSDLFLFLLSSRALPTLKHPQKEKKNKKKKTVLKMRSKKCHCKINLFWPYL